MTTKSSKYEVRGSVRGLVSTHRTLAAAQKSLARDQRGCRSQGGYSDCRIYIYGESVNVDDTTLASQASHAAA